MTRLTTLVALLLQRHRERERPRGRSWLEWMVELAEKREEI